MLIKTKQEKQQKKIEQKEKGKCSNSNRKKNAIKSWKFEN